jgi:polyisoprenoid-binding protein YceI
MKRTILSLALLAFVTTVAAANRFAAAKGSQIRIEGTSSLHAWKMEGATIDGRIDALPSDQWSATVTIPVKSIRSEHAKMDKLMAEALKADKNPVVRYELASAKLESSTPNALVAVAQGKLTIAGVTREVAMKVAGARDGETWTLTGEVPVRMSDYGIKPPTAMLGTIKTGNDVKVTFRWIVNAAN